MAAHPVVAVLTARHRPTLERALEAIRTRDHWSPYPEEPSGYREGARAAAEAAFRRLRTSPLDLGQPGRDGTVEPGGPHGERSLYGAEWTVSYPHSDPSALLSAAQAAMPGWSAAGPDARAAVCLEILSRINARSHEFALAAEHTSGHGPVMAFHAGAVHAQDRGLEAVALTWREQTGLPAEAIWRKPLREGRAIALTKRFTPVPVGVSLVVANRVFPAWNGYPGLFASLAAGNAVLVKPHPRAVLPLAMTVRTARAVLAEAGFSPDLVCLAAEQPGEGLARTLAVRPEVRLVDYSGTTAFGAWLVEHARQARVFTATSAVNSLLLESTDDYRDMLANLAFSVSLYSGQLCTSPQNLLIPRSGMRTDEGHKTYDEVVTDLGGALGTLLADDGAASGVLGALLGPEVRERVDRAMSGALGEVRVPSRRVVHPARPDVELRTPVVVGLDAAREPDRETLLAEWPGPVAFAVAVGSATAGARLMARTARRCGALSVGVHTTSPEVERAVEEACADTGVMLSVNLRGDWYISQSAVYSDLHATGLNPAGNCVYGDSSFVAARFRRVLVRRYEGTTRAGPSGV